jgi:hypothetical protein
MLFYDSAEYLTSFRRNLASDLDSVKPVGDLLFYRNQILDNFDKKYIQSGPGVDTEMECYLKFLRVNSEMKALNARYTSHLTDWDADAVLRRARYIIAAILHETPLMEEIFALSKHSGGTSIGVKYMDTSIEAKMTYPISGTAACCKLWEHYKHWDWNYYSQACSLNEGRLNSAESVSVATSRATTVPKTNKIDRFIAVEPTLNMFFQQGISACMDERLSRAGLSLRSDQEKHRRLAYEGSITSRYGTIDFSSMSDRMSLAACHYLLPRSWYSLLFTVRSHRTLMKGDVLPLHMISTMGNATTFPLETLVLYALAQSACSEVMGLTALDCRYTHDVHVYGDDCILPASACRIFIDACSKLGFVTNEKKTFLTGAFRESCGGDFYHGRDVRPYFLEGLSSSIKRKSDKEAYLYTTINGVLRMYIKYFGTLAYVYDKNLLRYLFSCLRTHTDSVKFVPEDYPDDSGVCHIRDMYRITAAYMCKPSRVGISKHGQLNFKFLRYKFPTREEVHEGLRYRTTQKWWSESRSASWSGYLACTTDVMAQRLRRRGGFYVETQTDKRDSPPVVTPTTLLGRYRSASLDTE